MSDIEENVAAEPVVAAAPKVKKPRTEKQIAATAALVARNKQKKADRQAAKEAEADAAEQAVNLKIVEIAAAEPDSDPDSDYELEATPQRVAQDAAELQRAAVESESSESESESSESESSESESSSDDGSDDGGIPTDSDSDDADDDLYESDEKGDEDEAPKTYTPKYFTSECEDGGYMTHLERANVVAKRKRPLHKGLLSRGW
jgi:hypothetical protein